MITRKISAPYSDPTRHMARYAIGFSTGLVGLADMLSAIVPKLHWDILLGEWPIKIHTGIQTLTVVVGFFLIMLSYGLMRGKYQAWRITLGLLLLSGILSILHGGLILSTLIALTLTILLFILHRYFQAKSDPPSVRRGYVVLTLGFGIVVTYAIGGFVLLYDQFGPLIDKIGLDNLVFNLFTHTPHLVLIRGTQAFLFGRALPVLSLSAILFGMLQILRPVTATLLPDEEEKQRVESLTHSYGTNSISYFSLDDDKTYFFSKSGKSVISYVLEGSVAVVAGDPIGPESEMQEVMEEFMAFCHTQDWTVVFWQVRDNLAEMYRSFGLRLFKIGEDAVINAQNFTLKGGAMANVRSSAKRAEKDGLRIIFQRTRMFNLGHIAQMELISQNWLKEKGGSEMGFSMGHFDPCTEKDQIYALAVDLNDKIHAFITFIPIYGRKGWGLDLMRRAEQCAPGTMELLLARSIEHLKDMGSEMVSLGLAPLSNANNTDETFLDNSVDFLTQRFGNPAKNQSLFNFKKKFQPTWESRYLVFSNTLTLPKIGWALFKAHQNEASFLSVARDGLADWRKQRATIRSLSHKPVPAHH